jgi:endoglucanase
MKLEDLNLDLLSRLTRVPGLPGREWEVADVIRTALPENCEVHQDAIGNLTAHIPGKGKRVMLVAHMDEVGLIVRRILPNGFLRVERMGGMNMRAMPGSPMTLWTEKGCLTAIVGVLPQHLDNGSELDLTSMYIDIGASSAKEVEDMGVRVGDGLTWYSLLKRMAGTRICSKALDDRLGCWVLLTLADLLKPSELGCDLYLTFTVQEETALMGGMPAVNTFKPDVVIGVDGTLTFDTPDLTGEQSEVVVGAGPAIKWMDTIRGKQVSFVPDQNLVRLTQQAARQLQIPLQAEITVGLSTAASPVPYAGSGIATLALSLPVRYHHSPAETADLSDVLHLVRLLQHLLTRPF